MIYRLMRRRGAEAIPVAPPQGPEEDAEDLPAPPVPAQAVSSAEHPEQLLGQALRAGVLTSLSFVLGGMVLTFLRHPDYLSSSEALERITQGTVRPHTLREVLDGLHATQGQSFVMVGLLWMMMVPFLRVALSIFVFRQQKDRTFVVLTSAVLALLVISAVGR